MTASSDLRSPTAYLERLVRAVIATESVELDSPIDVGHVAAVLRDRLYPMLLEWSALPFLPPAELLVLFDRFHVPPSELRRDQPGLLEANPEPFHFFAFELADSDGCELATLVARECDGLRSPSVIQAVRARALAIVCPVPRPEGCYRGRLADLRAAFKDPGRVRAAFHAALREKRQDVAELFGLLDLEWLARQASTWNHDAIREFLSGRLRPKRLREEQLSAALEAGARALLPEPDDGETIDPVEAACEALRSRPSGEIAEAVFRRVLPVVGLDDRPWASQELPTGGYSDLATRGSFDRLLISNLAYPEEEFARRLVENELLFYELEAPPAARPPRQVVLLDASPPTWGIPRIAGAAVAVGVAERARGRGAEASILAAGRIDRPFDGLDRADGLRALLDHQRWDDGLRGDLDALAERLRSDADLFVCTEAGRVAELAGWAAAANLPESLRLSVFAVDLEDGRATLWRREGGGFVPAATLSLAAKDLLPPPSAPAWRSVEQTAFPAAIEVEWDWSSNVSCAAIRDDGLAVTGHENGEVHLWDAAKGRHLGQPFSFPHKVEAVAVSGDHVVLALRRMMDGVPIPSTLFHFRIGDARLAPLCSRLAHASPAAILPGWKRGQFFWWESDERLVEYGADLHSHKPHPGCLKPPGRPFVVDPVSLSVLWTGPDGLGYAFHGGATVATPRVHPLLRQEVHLLAVDPSGGLTARGANGGRDAAVYSPEKIVHIEGAQRPLAVNAAADRLVCANSNSLWFWSLGDGTLVRKVVAAQQKVREVSVGTHEAGGDAVAIRFADGTGILLHWDPEGVFVDGLGGTNGYVSGVSGARGQFSMRDSHAVSGAFPVRTLALGRFTLVLRSDRRLDFLACGDGEPLLRFWFRPSSWVLASRDFVARDPYGAPALPEDCALVRDPARLARILELGAKGAP